MCVCLSALQPAIKIFILGILAGFQVGIGAAFAVATLGGLPAMKVRGGVVTWHTC
jgi:formate/nitrite transporter FocA (FNT family)